MPYQLVEFKAKILILGMTTLLTLAAMFSAIATTTPRVSYSSKLDIWMVFCVIFVFGTLQFWYINVPDSIRSVVHKVFLVEHVLL